MAKTKPLLWRDVPGAQWVVYRCSGMFFYCEDYDEALAEFERQVELYREPERKRLLGWIDALGAARMVRLGSAPWLDEPEDK